MSAKPRCAEPLEGQKSRVTCEVKATLIFPKYLQHQAVSLCACTNGVGKLKALVHGPLMSRSGMLMSNNAGMLETKVSHNE